MSCGNRDKFLSAPRLYARGAKLNKDKKVVSEADFTAKENELEYYVSLA
jgi:hypothetical protein